MRRALQSFRLPSLVLLTASLLSVLPGFGRMITSRAATSGPGNSLAGQSRTRPLPVSISRAFVNYRSEGAVGCRDAGEEEAAILKRRDGRSMHVISPDRSLAGQSLNAEATGLQIILRGTEQLESFPTVRAAFLNAAAAWESVIDTPVTIVIDVDFGATWFGEPYDENVLGQTDSQTLGDSSIYGEVRSALVGLAASDSRTGLYNQLPLSSVPTDLGATSYVLAPSAVWRALGFIDPVADPSAEQSDLGEPPAVGFNSDFDYDFDPSDGISSNRIDFDAVAVHEIGHVLGFDSNTGYRELVRNSPIAVSVWDIFRFRPGVTLSTFATAQRVLSSGGRQAFFDGGGGIALSTGRPDGTGGDTEQASHWKDDRFTGQHIGIMDPTLADGTRETITENDIAVLSSLGYAVSSNQSAPGAPAITKASFNGQKLKIKGTGFSGQVELEINSLVISTAAAPKINSSGKKLVIKASQGELNLQSGSNQVRVISNGVRSNAFTFVF